VTSLPIVSLVFAVLSIFVPTVGLVPIGARAPAPAKTLGVVGCALLIFDGFALSSTPSRSLGWSSASASPWSA
jgi:hypothetical protein